MGRALLLCVLVLWTSPLGAFQDAAQPEIDEDTAILAFLRGVETAIATSDRASWLSLISSNADPDQAIEFFDAVVTQGLTRVVVRERDRAALPGALPGEGYRLIVEVFLESGARGRITTWRLDIRRPRGQPLASQPWRIIAQDRLSVIEGLHHLSLEPNRQFQANDLIIRSVDFELRLPSGDVFVAETAEGVTALVLLGDGSMIFAPKPEEERGQVHLFAGSDTIEAPFTVAFVRLNPFEFDRRINTEALAAVDVDDGQLRRATEVFEREVLKSFGLDLSDLSRETWSLLPAAGDFLAEVRTRRFDWLTYARSSREAEDVTLFHRERRRNISVYASEQKLSSRGRFYNEDDLAEYDVLDYSVDADFDPAREWLTGRSRLKLRVNAFAIGSVTLKLAEAFTVNGVSSDELGRLMFLRIRNQNSIVINLPSPVARGAELTLNLSYQGRVEPQSIDDESLSQGRRQSPQRQEDIPIVASEPNWLFSNRSQWYPQGLVSDYATATVRLTVPQPFAVVGSGVRVSGTPVLVEAGTAERPGRVLYAFQAIQPVRYLGIVVSRLADVAHATVAIDVVPPEEPLVTRPVTPGERAAGPPIGARHTIDLRIMANPRQQQRGIDALPIAAEILRLYASIVGDVPYESMTLAMVEHDLPGGHSPGYFAAINNPLPTTPFFWKNDPATFSDFPEFFIAHEIAHQWWGQAVGWKNYHEQWLSEGFAQYFAALYARERHGEQAFRDILEQLRRWAMSDSDQGAIYLGYRLGHIKGEPRVFRAVAYNKGASVLHMLRRLVGDEAFFRGIRRYYAENRFQKAGTDDLRRAMEQESGRPLERFFERWVYGSTLPRLRMSSSVEEAELVVHAEQLTEVFDVPVTVTVIYDDGRTEDVVFAVTEAKAQMRIPLSGSVREVEFNRDSAALGEIES